MYCGTKLFLRNCRCSYLLVGLPVYCVDIFVRKRKEWVGGTNIISTSWDVSIHPPFTIRLIGNSMSMPVVAVRLFFYFSCSLFISQGTLEDAFYIWIRRFPRPTKIANTHESNRRLEYLVLVAVACRCLQDNGRRLTYVVSMSSI